MVTSDMMTAASLTVKTPVDSSAIIIAVLMVGVQCLTAPYSGRPSRSMLKEVGFWTSVVTQKRILGNVPIGGSQRGRGCGT